MTVGGDGRRRPVKMVGFQHRRASSSVECAARAAAGHRQTKLRMVQCLNHAQFGWHVGLAPSCRSWEARLDADGADNLWQFNAIVGHRRKRKNRSRDQISEILQGEENIADLVLDFWSVEKDLGLTQKSLGAHP